jgi:hypothetical protein
MGTSIYNGDVYDFMLFFNTFLYKIEFFREYHKSIDVPNNCTGYYMINNIPQANDYVVTITPSNYEKAVKSDQSTGTAVDFTLE